MKHTHCFVVGVLCLAFGTSVARAQTDRWISSEQPIYGGIIRSFAVGDGTLYAGTWGDGVFSSNNRGGRWQFSGLAEQFILSLGATPAAPRTVLAGTLAGMYRSDDGGRTWATGGVLGVVRAIGIDPENPKRVYVGSDEQGLMRSTDGGNFWGAWDDGLPADALIYSFAFDRQPPRRVYVGTSHGLYASDSERSVWEPVGFGNVAVRSVLIHPDNQDTLYVATWGRGIFGSEDRGVTWEEKLNPGLRKDPFNHVNCLAFDPKNSDTLYAGTGGRGILRGAEKGMRWEFRPGDTGVIYSMGSDRTSIYAGTEGDGVYRKDAPDDPWTTVKNGITNAHVRAIVIDPTNPANVYAATWGGGTYRSRDGGNLWESIRQGLGNLIVIGLAIDPSSPNRLYATTDGSGIFRTENGGDWWEPVNRGLTAGIFVSVAIDPSDPRTVYGGAEAIGVFKSEDRADTWRHMGMKEGAMWALAVHPKSPKVILGGTWGSERWGTEGIGIYRSEDGGETWMQVLSSKPVVSIVHDPFNPDVVYAATFGDGVYRSSDAGLSWTLAENAGLAEGNAWSVIADPMYRNVLYLGTWGGGVFVSRDAGNHWKTMNDGLKSPYVYCLAIHADNARTLHVGTSAGAARYEIAPPTVDEPNRHDEPDSTTVPTETRLFSSYPNPSPGDVWIPFQLAESAAVSFDIFDTVGRSVRRFRPKTWEAGTYATPSRALHWDGKNENGEPAASGVYFYVFQAGRYRRIGKFVVHGR